VIVHLLVISDVKMVVTYESTVVWKDSTSFNPYPANVEKMVNS